MKIDAGRVIVTLLFITAIAVVAFVAAIRDHIKLVKEFKEEDNSDLSQFDFLDCEKPWIENYN